MCPIRASPVRLSGTNVGCFLPKVRSARARRPPTLMRPSVLSRNGLFANSSWRFTDGSELIVPSPLGHASFCISFCRIRDASCELGVLCFCFICVNRFSHASPEVISSVAWRCLVMKYEDGLALNVLDENKLVLRDFSLGVDGGLGFSNLRNGGLVSHTEALSSLTEIGRVPMSAGLWAVGM